MAYIFLYVNAIVAHFFEAFLNDYAVQVGITLDFHRISAWYSVPHMHFDEDTTQRVVQFQFIFDRYPYCKTTKLIDCLQMEFKSPLTVDGEKAAEIYQLSAVGGLLGIG